MKFYCAISVNTTILTRKLQLGTSYTFNFSVLVFSVTIVI